MEMKMYRVRFDEEVRIEGIEVISSRIGCNERRVVEPEDSPSAQKFIKQLKEDFEMKGVFYLDDGDGEDVDPSAARIMTLSEAEAYVSWSGHFSDARCVEIDGDGDGECLQISWHETFTRSVTVELAR